MKLYDLNDYELVSLVKSHNEDALSLLVLKYSNFIYLIAHQYKIRRYEMEDYYSEGLLILYEAIMKYDDNLKVPFMSYFSLLLKRRFRTIISKSYRDFSTIENIKTMKLLEENVTYNEVEIDLNKMLNLFKSDIDIKTFQGVFIKGLSILEVAKNDNYEVKQIYNALYRIKTKIKNTYNNF